MQRTEALTEENVRGSQGQETYVRRQPREVAHHMIPIIFQSHRDKNANDGEHLVTAGDSVGEGWKIKAHFPVETVSG